MSRSPDVTFRPIDLRNRSGAVVARALVDEADAHLAEKPWYRLRNGYAVRTEIVDGKLFHDPHPSRDGLAGEVEEYEVLVPLAGGGEHRDSPINGTENS